MARSIWKPVTNYLNKEDIDTIFFSQNLRKATILTEHMGQQVFIHNGSSKLTFVEIKKLMVGFKYGQLSLTKKKVFHQVKKKKKK